VEAVLGGGGQRGETKLGYANQKVSGGQGEGALQGKGTFLVKSRFRQGKKTVGLGKEIRPLEGKRKRNTHGGLKIFIGTKGGCG